MAGEIRKFRSVLICNLCVFSGLAAVSALTGLLRKFHGRDAAQPLLATKLRKSVPQRGSVWVGRE